MTKVCRKCKQGKPDTAMVKNRRKPGGLESWCKACHADAQAVRDQAKADAQDAQVLRDTADRARRLASDTEPLRLEDFAPSDDDYDVSVGNGRKPGDKRLSAQASREKKQEFNQAMGDNVEALKRAAATAHTRGGDVVGAMPAESGTYIGQLAEQERRFGNRRLARSISLAQAQEQLALQQYKLFAERYFSSKITASGYARKLSVAPVKRSTVLMLSDLHIGSDLDSLDEPLPFRAVEEARRLEFIMRQTIDYKTQYRKNSELVLLLNGDLIEGQLMHDFRSGAPLAEQKAVFWMYFRAMLAEFSAAFPTVRVFCQPGNHGRDKVRHPGRATARKWDGHEHELYFALRMMCSDLKNVSWSIPLRAVSAVPLHGSILGLTHGDTEIKLGHPDGAAKSNARELDRINATRIFGAWFDAWAFGHFHSGRFIPGNPGIIFNAALVPPNGHARASGYIGEACGQFLWEATAGYPIGDVRFLRVGSEQDNDENLGKIIKPFRFQNDYDAIV